ncbi:hypothetical protein EDC65_1980 [Stella humosa]|uniref:Putative DnaT-like domain-containing protein n=2 Tax=Stella humosa TaxID=94 RepID=A0A3N1LY99_9PROT|nr:hypothetical protein EDC65_1980 [Stella humosa]
MVETGAGVAGADSYLALAAADAHHAAMGALAWPEASDPVRESALRRATAAVDGLFADRWKGTKAVPWSVNGLAWPRRDVRDAADQPIVSADTLPAALLVAVAEAARLELEQPGCLAEAARAVRRFALGPLSVEMAAGDPLPPAVSLALAPLLRPPAPVPRLAVPAAAPPPFRAGMHDGGQR